MMPAAPPSTLRPARAAAWRRWALSAAFSGTTALAITATSAGPAGSEPTTAASPDPDPDPATATAAAGKAARVRCWGQLVDIHGVEATAAAPASFDFVVRMHDGSMHAGASQGLESWQVGDRILVFGCVPAAGAAAAR